ncbi:hypothetical protein DPMN_150448 [Dreissena polymorpha]|uniref:Uncharacterized protein n=1 Tax=Dreissena polymorpha TaxID=45954 RepID=A0A9D4FHQ9_DREPO|nr:hypothetical protein DPMN_150448 [Dreissena polymorpha]
MDFMELLDNPIDTESSWYRENANSCKTLFWEQQLKYNQLKDKPQMRWNPMVLIESGAV